MTNTRGRIVPVLLSGGKGSRLRPLSRETYPKQLLALLGDRTLLQQTALRVAEPSLFSDPMVIANAQHRFAIGEQLRAVGVPRASIVLEPFGRNTAPAVTIAALLASEADPDAVILVMPVDHWVMDEGKFREGVLSGLEAARSGNFILFGLQPTAPSTGFGYIGFGDQLPSVPRVYRVSAFVEKPDLLTAEQLVAGKQHLWNSGIFLLPARKFVEEMARLAPEVLVACRETLSGATQDLDFLRLAEGAFEACPSRSIDYAVLEKTERAAVIAASFDWSDIGCWSALWEIGIKDGSGNVAVGNVAMEDANESIFVPLGCMHRLENPGKVPLNLIEVQSGPYLGEDDIVRVHDIYHRL